MVTVGEFQREAVRRERVVLVHQGEDRIGEKRRFRLFAVGEHGRTGRFELFDGGVHGSREVIVQTLETDATLAVISLRDDQFVGPRNRADGFRGYGDLNENTGKDRTRRVVLRMPYLFHVVGGCHQTAMNVERINFLSAHPFSSCTDERELVLWA